MSFLPVLLGTVMAVQAGAAAPARPVAILTLLEASEPRLAPGGEGVLRLRFRLREGFHVQANPVANPDLIPTTLSVDAVPALELGPPRYPPGSLFHLDGSEEALPTFGGDFEIELPLRIKAGAAPGLRRLRAKLHYQGCDARSCLFPRELRLNLRVRILRSGP